MTGPHLNRAQIQAVEHAGGPTLVLAGAGSGKTRVLTARIVHLIERCDVRPYQILAVTFTNRAANEMRRRVGDLLGREPDGLWIGTFHAIAARLLRREAELLGFTSRFTIYDETDSLSLIRRLLEEGGYPPKTTPARVVRALISNAKNRLVTPAEFRTVARSDIELAAAQIFDVYVERLSSQNAMDFDDLLLHPLTLFEQHPDRLEVYQERFRAILVDEYQDTNRAQYLLVHHLSAQHRSLCVVGDDDQSIYSWRGADVRNMLDFQRDYPDAVVYRLEENYRSTQMILDAANGVIAVNSERLGKTLFTGRGRGEPVVLVTTADDTDESDWVAKEVLDRTSNDHYAFADIAVLYRTNAQSRSFEDAFRRANIPFRVVGSVSFYARREIKDLLAYLRLLVNPSDDESFLRAIQIPRRGLGVTSVNTLSACAQQWQRSLLDTAAIADRISELRPQAKKGFIEFSELIHRLSGELSDRQPAALIERVIAEIDYEGLLMAEGPEGADRWENVRELVSSAAEWAELYGSAEDAGDGTPLERYLAEASLTTSLDESSDEEPGVTLMTVHTAKGLEWPIVIVAGLEDGLFPLSRSLETQDATEEERRLAYVAITRAQDRLYLTWAKARRREGQRVPQKASRFLAALPPGVVDARSTSSGQTGFGYRVTATHAMVSHALASPGVPTAAPEMESQDAPRYIKGERVRHRTFGSGTIRGLSGVGRNLKVIVHFDEEETGTKELLITHAGLERDWDSA